MTRDTLKLPLRLVALGAMVAARRAARAIGRAIEVPWGAEIVRPSVTRWAVDVRPHEYGTTMCRLHHDDMAELSDVTVWEPLRWGPVVLVCLWDPEGWGDVWVLDATDEVTDAGIDRLKTDRATADAAQRARWAAEMEGS